MPATRQFVGFSGAKRIGVVAFLVLALTLGATTAGWAGARARSSTIRWHSCGSQLPPNLQCGKLAVPLD